MRRFRGRVSLWVVLGMVATAGAVSHGVTASANGCNTGKCALGALSLPGGSPPLSLAAGSTTTIDFALTNEANPQSLGSADLVAPSGFVIPAGQQPTVVGSTGTASVSSDGTTVILRSLNLAPLAKATVAFEVTVPCAAASSAWSLVVKQANDFSGPPGNNFAIDTGSYLTTTVSGSCSLSFSVQPKNAVVSTNISNQGFEPSEPPAAAVAVEAKDGMGNPAPGVTVTLGLVGGGGATLTGGAPTLTDASGEATFASLSINQTGYFQLEATAAGFPSALSSGFQITSTFAPCTSGSCSTSSSGTSDAAFATALAQQLNGDILSLGLGGFSYSCNTSALGNYHSVSDAVGTDVWQTGGSMIDPAANGQVTIEIFKSTVKLSTNRGASGFQICYASTLRFTTRLGTQSPQFPNTPPGSLPLFYGLLPDCGNATTAPVPCVLSRNKDNAGDVVITFLGTGDFWGEG